MAVKPKTTFGLGGGQLIRPVKNISTKKLITCVPGTGIEKSKVSQLPYNL